MSLPADNIHKHSADPVDPCAPCNFPLGAGSHFVLVHLLTCFCDGHFFSHWKQQSQLLKHRVCVYSASLRRSRPTMKLGVAAGHMVPEAEWHSKRPTAARAYTNPPNTPGWQRQRKQNGFHGEQGLRKHTQKIFEVGRGLAEGQLYEKRKGKFGDLTMEKKKNSKESDELKKVTCMWPPDALPSNSKTPPIHFNSTQLNQEPSSHSRKFTTETFYFLTH